MRVFKFGGASVKDADGVRNLKKVLEQIGFEDLLVVVSAMGKATNAIEEVVAGYMAGSDGWEQTLNDIFDRHRSVSGELFGQENHRVFRHINALHEELCNFLKHNKSRRHSFVYDQVVPYGELLSTRIVSAFLNDNGIPTQWTDSRAYIKTDSSYREARINWELTGKHIQALKKPGKLVLTQGFIGSDEDSFTTTLGREGSDHTAAIFAYCLDAESVTIWKDVPGVLSADPRVFENTQLLQRISYKEVIEMAFYGASVIHPKTLQPLQRKGIPLYVKSFENPQAAGTAVCKGKDIDPKTPCFVLKKNQVLISLSSLDFSFMMEDHIGEVFKMLHRYRMKVSLIQNSAISFSVCVDNHFDKLDELVSRLKSHFRVVFNERVTLYTIRHFTEADIHALEAGRKVFLRQQSRETVQIVVSS